MTVFQTLYWALSQWNYQSGTAFGHVKEVLQCMFDKTSTIFSININCLLYSQALYGTEFKQHLEKNGLKGVIIQNHGGTASGRKGHCCNALGFCITG